MKSASLRIAGASLITLAAVAVVGVGCSSNKPSTATVDYRQDAVKSLGTLRGDLSQTDAQIQATQVSLHQLANAQSGDLTQPYKAFDDNVNKTIAMDNTLNNRTTSVTNTSYQFMNTWNYNANTIRDDQMRRDAVQSQQQAHQNYNQLLSSSNDVQAAYANYTRELQDVRAFAAANLTADGLQKLRGQVGKVDAAANDLRQKIANLDSRANQLASSWQSTLPQPQYYQYQPQQQPQPTPAGGQMQPGQQPPSGQQPYQQPGEQPLPGSRSESSGTMNQPQNMGATTMPTNP